jgi:hypothetical protein
VASVKVRFHRGEAGQYSVHIHRPDGVVVSLPGAGGRWPVPHDLAHIATERALEIAGGVFGSAASGAMFNDMAVVSGRLRHDPKRRSQEVLRTNTKDRMITVAETMTSLVHDAVQHGRSGELLRRARGVWGTVREDSFPFTPAQFQTAVQDLRDLSERWARTPAGGVLDVEWPDDLVSRQRARSGRRS